MHLYKRFFSLVAILLIVGQSAYAQVVGLSASGSIVRAAAQKVVRQPKAPPNTSARSQILGLAANPRAQVTSRRAQPLPIRTHRFSFSGRARIVRSHQTSVNGTGGTVSLSLDLGAPQIKRSNSSVKKAPPGVSFSQIEWPLLKNNMPGGLTLLTSEGGGPDVPILSVTLAIPANATNIVPIVHATQTTPLGSIRLLPAEHERNGVLIREYDPAQYANFPKATLSTPQTFRSLRFVSVNVPLVEDNGRSALESLTVGVRFSLIGVAPSGTVKDPVFAELNSEIVANPYDLGRFAVPLRGAQKLSTLAKGSRALSGATGSDSVYNWIDTKAPYIRLAVTRDGLYRIPASQLNFPAQGFTLSSAGWNAQNIRCINHGEEIPIWVDSDANGNILDIDFYGEHLHGFPLPTVTNDPPSNTEKPLPEYYNVATDTNVYWLTSATRPGDTAPRRFRTLSQFTTAAPVLTSGTVLLHHEQDHNYYFGDAVTDATQTIHMTPYVAGERFYWTVLHGVLDPAAQKDTTLTHFEDTFYIAQLPADTAGKFATVKFLLRGISNDVDTHLVDAQINNESPSLPSIFQDFNYDSLTLTVPLSELRVGANIARVNALTNNIAGVDQFYLDYYEVRYPSALVPSIDTGISKGQWLFSEAPHSPVFQLAISNPSASVYDLTDGTRLELHGGNFVDSTSSPNPIYAAATANSLLQCADIRPWNLSGTRGWNILAGSDRADYIVITPPEFLHAAQELAANRSGEGLNSQIWTTDEIFNAFDYGSGEPISIRRFLNYAYQNYSGTPVSFVTLLGDASWDPKFNIASSFHRSFVPTYGWPVSDYYFTLPGTGDSNLAVPPLMLIARIPGSSEEAVESYIAKLVEYESEPPASWDRHFLFLSGGEAGGQHLSFDAAIQSWIGTDTSGGELGLMLPPTSIQPTIVERTDFTSGVDATHVGEIEDALQRGQSIMYFGGHGATFTSDILFPDASILNNKGLYPLLMTLTCQTGAFAEPNLISVNESYIDAKEAGSVQAYGTTGFGEEDYDDYLTTYFFQHVRSYDSTHDTTKPQSMNMLSLLTWAKVFASGFAYSGGLNAGYNATLQNSMLGDAATGFIFRPQPEFAVYSSEIHAYAANDTVPRTSLSVSDSVMTIRALIHNYGYSAERPVVIRITDAGPSGLPFSLFDTLSRLDTSALATAYFALNTQSIGEHTISVQIDPDSSFPESYRPDDFAQIQIRVNGLSTTPFYPYEGSRDFCDISPGNVHFVVLTPSGTTIGDQVELELDTTDQFTNPFLDQKTSAGSSYYVTLEATLPASPVPTSSVYWWRTRVMRANGDTTDWQNASFSTASAPRSEFSYSSREQDSSTIITGLAMNSKGQLYLPSEDTIRLEAISHGLNDSTLGNSFAPFAQIFINGHPFYEAGGGNSFNGFAILTWTPDGTQISASDLFYMPWQSIGNQAFEDSNAAAFDSVIASVPSGRRVIVLSIGSVDFPYFIDSTKAALLTLGSSQGMKPMVYDGSYALIGTKGSAPGTASEAFAAAYSGGAHAFDTSVTSGTSGLAEIPFTAIARDYGALTWTGDPIPAGSDITFRVLGERRDGNGIDLVDTFEASRGTSFDLSHTDPRVYDRLSVEMNFVRTSNGTQSPAVSGIALQYDAAPELLFTTDSIQTVPHSVTAGQAVVAKYSVQALTCTPADSMPLLLTRSYQNKLDTVAWHTLAQVTGHGTQSFSDTLPTANELGSVALAAAINPNDTVNEQLLFNDNIAGSFTVTRDTTKPSIQILFDGRNIPNGGYVSSNTTIQINLLSSNPMRDTARSSITAASLIYLSGSQPENFHIDYYSYPQGFQQPEFGTDPSGPTNPIQAYLRFKPNTPYSPGEWLLTATVTDASGNTDTLQEQFTISNVNGLEHVMNYPNPFKDKTDFTFVLRNDDPVDVKIVVYTIAGRKIRTLTPVETHAGFNAVEWDGRDERGNAVADGTYLYRVIINGKNGDNVSDAVTERAVRDR